jgi:hypothetical protein
MSLLARILKTIIALADQTSKDGRRIDGLSRQKVSAARRGALLLLLDQSASQRVGQPNRGSFRRTRRTWDVRSRDAVPSPVYRAVLEHRCAHAHRACALSMPVRIRTGYARQRGLDHYVGRVHRVHAFRGAHRGFTWNIRWPTDPPPVCPLTTPRVGAGPRRDQYRRANEHPIALHATPCGAWFRLGRSPPLHGPDGRDRR